ncbi:MAG: class I SAM-dependent methyltransferase [Saprospiraceae bacterium]|nr:class I SAM-dependent methyltransferase [Lewinellaceae bacterium]
MPNKDSWDSLYTVKSYEGDYELQKPEITILEILKDTLKGCRMLDIGIGLGRTTHHFAPLVKEYIGMDYSFRMINTYQKTFPDTPKNVSIRLGDVRLMQEFQSNSFDVVLFSFNGIDYISQEDRLLALEEIKRVGRKGGHFIFSTHNLQYVDNLYSIKFGNGLKYFLYQCYRYLRLFYENGGPGKYRNKDFAFLNDGAHHFQFQTFYIKPLAQIAQLQNLGFKNIRLFSVKTGDEIEKSQSNGANKDSWIYYLCEFP